jgi:hypothetical protein
VETFQREREEIEDDLKYLGERERKIRESGDTWLREEVN